MAEKKKPEEIKDQVRKYYADAIGKGSCCGPQAQDIEVGGAGKFAKLAGYTDLETGGVPTGATSFGCGNPVNFIDVKPGDVVLDLGSGAGLDMILAARKVGSEGKVIGLDMTDEMIARCRENLAEAGIKNAEVRKGEMEDMPVDNASVDWIISNCVINLSPQKEKVFAEAFRVLKPGGRLLVSDIVASDLPDHVREDMAAWAGCIAGAVGESDYLQLMRDAGFEDVRVVEKMTYDASSFQTFAGEGCGCGSGEPDEKSMAAYAHCVASVRVHARKPK